MKKRCLAIFLVVFLLMGLIPTAFAKTGAENVVQVAFKYYGQKATAATFGFSSDWCGSFLYYIANEAGEGAAMGGSEYTMQYNPRSMDWFIANGAKVGYFYDALPNNTEASLNSNLRMNKSDYIPQLGDIIYFDWEGYGNGGLYHVEIVTHMDGRGISTVGGNTNGDYWWDSSVNARWSIIDDSPYIVAFARPNYKGSGPEEVQPTPPPSVSPDVTKTQYRYHRYIDNNGEYAICPYYGNVTYNTVMHLEYTDWLDSPLPEIKRGYVNYLEHPYQGASCDNAGCIDGATFQVHRHEDASGGVWYYEETRTVEAPAQSIGTPPPAPVVTPSPAPAVTPAPTPKPTHTPLPTVSPNPIPTPTASLTPTPTPTPTSAPTPTPTPTPSVKPEFESRLENVFVPTRPWSNLQFDDISAGDWYYDNVKNAYRLGLMNGTATDTFRPEGTLTVAESIALAARIHAAYYGNTIPTYDGGNWYDGAVSYAREHGIPANTPYEIPATRETFADILAAALPTEELWDNGNSVSFADAALLRRAEEVCILSRAGVINGISRNGSTFFEPNGNVTRAQAAAIITRIVIPSTRLGN